MWSNSHVHLKFYAFLKLGSPFKELYSIGNPECQTKFDQVMVVSLSSSELGVLVPFVWFSQNVNNIQCWVLTPRGQNAFRFST